MTARIGARTTARNRNTLNSRFLLGGCSVDVSTCWAISESSCSEASQSVPGIPETLSKNSTDRLFEPPLTDRGGLREHGCCATGEPKQKGPLARALGVEGLTGSVAGVGVDRAVGLEYRFRRLGFLAVHGEDTGQALFQTGQGMVHQDVTARNLNLELHHGGAAWCDRRGLHRSEERRVGKEGRTRRGQTDQDV